MIKSLNIENFGKFKRKTFTFSPVTLFYGKNEAGKTTLFDALTEGLCSPKGTTEAGRRIRDRYGAEKKAVLEFEGEPITLDAADFLNLFAVRSGAISLSIDSNSAWMNQVKAELFSGGIDPLSVVRRLEGDMTRKGRGTLLAQAASLETELKSLREELSAASAERQSCLVEEKRIEDGESKRSRAGDEIERLEREIERLSASVEQQNLIRERKILLSVLGQIGEKRKTSEELGRGADLSAEALRELKEKDRSLRELSSRLDGLRVLRREAEGELSRLLEEKAEAEREKGLCEGRRAAAEIIRTSLGREEDLIDRKPVFALRLLPALTAVFALAASFLLFLFLPPSLSLIGLAGGAILTLLFGFLSLKKEIREDRSRLISAIAEGYGRWRAETGEQLQDGGRENLLSLLDRAADKARDAALLFDAARDRAVRAEKKLAGYAADISAMSGSAERTEKELQALLRASGTTDLTDYAGRLERRRLLEEKLNRARAAIEEAVSKYGVSSETDLEADLTARIAELGLRILEPELGNDEVRMRENRLRSEKSRLETLRAEERGTHGDLSRDIGELRARFRELPEKILSLEMKIGASEKSLSEVRLNLAASGIARDIFNSLSKDADSLLAGLSRDIGAYFADLTSRRDAVHFSAFSVGDASVIDAEGEGRSELRLSTGTRDAFLLAARLTLAEKSVEGGRPALIVLDEPFIALDRFRIEKALEVLRVFQERTGWQIILFTKDEKLEPAARKTFGGLFSYVDLSIPAMETRV